MPFCWNASTAMKVQEKSTWFQEALTLICGPRTRLLAICCARRWLRGQRFSPGSTFSNNIHIFSFFLTITLQKTKKKKGKRVLGRALSCRLISKHWANRMLLVLRRSAKCVEQIIELSGTSHTKWTHIQAHMKISVNVEWHYTWGLFVFAFEVCDLILNSKYFYWT